MPTIDDKIEIIKKAMFSPVPIPLPDKTKLLKDQCQAIFTFWQEKYLYNDGQIRNWIINELPSLVPGTGKIDINKATRLLRIAKELMGNVAKSSKAWRKFQSEEIILKAAQMAKDAGDYESLGKQGQRLAEVAGVNKEGDEDLFSQAFVPEWEVTGDVSVLGITPIPNLDQKKKKIKKKYFADPDIQDAEIVE